MIESIGKEMAYQISEEQKALRDEIASVQSYVHLVGEMQKTGGKVESDPRIVGGMRLSQLHGLYQGDIQLAEQGLLDLRRRLFDQAGVTSPAEEQIWMQPVGAGGIIGMHGGDGSSGPKSIYWRTVAEFIGYHASPIIRRGVDPMLGDRRFARWLIPGVAEPPVYTFMGLLTAFVLLVGPVAYRRTAKHGRSYLMFAIAPALALGTTLAMFGYGIVSDGFGTVARARQLTWVDGKSGDAGERIRTTYFAGVRPADGLRFPGDAEVISYPEGAGLPWREINESSPETIGTVRVRADSQIFDSSFLPSRQQRQFVVHAPRLGIGHLQLSADPAAPTVENGFDFVIREAVIRDDLGSYWTVENLQPGATESCQPLKAQNASKELGRLYNDHRPLSRVRETSDKQRRYDNQNL